MEGAYGTLVNLPHVISLGTCCSLRARRFFCRVLRVGTDIWSAASFSRQRADNNFALLGYAQRRFVWRDSRVDFACLVASFFESISFVVADGLIPTSSNLSRVTHQKVLASANGRLLPFVSAEFGLCACLLLVRPDI